MYTLIVPVATVLAVDASSFRGYAQTLLFVNNFLQLDEQPCPVSWSVAVTLQMSCVLPVLVAFVEKSSALRTTRAKVTFFVGLFVALTVVKPFSIFRRFPEFTTSHTVEHIGAASPEKVLEASRAALGTDRLPWEGSMPYIESSRETLSVYVFGRMSTLMCAPTFFLGAALAYATKEPDFCKKWLQKCSDLYVVSVYLLCAVLTFVLHSTYREDFVMNTALVFGFTMPFIAVWLHASIARAGFVGRATSKFLRAWPLQHLAPRTYSLYMTHAFVLVPVSLAFPRFFSSHDLAKFSLTTSFTVMACILFAYLVSRFVEKPLYGLVLRSFRLNKTADASATGLIQPNGKFL